MNRFVVFLALVMAALPVRAEELKVYTSHLPPFIMENADRPGLAVEIVQEVARRAGITPTFVFRPWLRAQADVHNGSNIAIMPLARNAEREANYAWVGDIFDIEVAFIGVGGRQHTLDSARKLNTVLVQDGTSFVTTLKNAGFNNLVTRTDTVTNGRMLAGGRVDAWYVPKAEAAWVWKIGKLPGKPDIGPKIEDETQWLAMSPGSDPNVVERLRKAIASMVADGTRDRIVRSYLE